MKVRKEGFILGSEFEDMVYHGGGHHDGRGLRQLVML